MKNFYKISLFLVLFGTLIFLIVDAQVIYQKQYIPIYSIKITAPPGGETLTQGISYDIKWNSTSNIQLVRISYSYDSTGWLTIQSCTKNTNGYRWLVPKISSDKVKIRIEAVSDCKNLSALAAGISGEFSIKSPFATCTEGCTCLTEASANKTLKNYEKCQEDVCGYEYPQTTTATALIKTPKYCFRAKEIRIEPLPARPLPLPEGSVSCNSCKSCTDALRNGKYVVLTQDIEDKSGTCIFFRANNTVFDCQNHKISGFGIGIEFYSGIEMIGAYNSTVENCTIEGFESGIALYSSTHNEFINNTLTLNGAGIWLGGGRINNITGEVTGGSNYNKIINSTINNNNQGIYLPGSKNTQINSNIICRNAVADIYTSPYAVSSGNSRSGNACDLIYNWNGDGDYSWCASTCTANVSTTVSSASGLQGALDGGYGSVELANDITAEGGISLNASHVTLLCSGHRITGTGSGTGVEIKNKVNVELNDCIIENFNTGLSLESASHSRILSNTIKNNDYGLIMRSGTMPSRSNTISDNNIKPNDIYGVYMDGDVWDNDFVRNELKGSQYSLYTTARCDNNIEASNKAGNAALEFGYYHDSSGQNIDHQQFGELIICNVRDSNFARITVDNGDSKSDGVLIINSQNVQLKDSFINSDYNGVIVRNSTGVKLQRNSVTQHQKDCIQISQSTGTEVTGGTITGCDHGVYLNLARDTKVEQVSLMIQNRVAAIKLYMSGGGEFNDNVISLGDSAPATAQGIVLEYSDDNKIENNMIGDMQTGVLMDASSHNNRLESNSICRNGNDIWNMNISNTGSNNNCSRHGGWKDEGKPMGCTNCCSPPVSDIDNDGLDDACDCTDMYRGHNEIGVDCGGVCPECVECTWCDSKVEPLRIRGHPNDGYIDVVFAPEEDWGSDWNGFLQVVMNATREKFLNIDKVSTRPLYTNYTELFNFYVYHGSGEETSLSGSCYDPEGPEGSLCIGCKGWLPGEFEYSAWIYSCSISCALSLGLACWCFALEPDHFWDHASFADSAGIIKKGETRGCSGFGPTSHFTAAYCGNRGNVILHEFGHSFFAMTDEYCGDTAYSTASNKANVWGSLSSCQSTATSEGWTDGNCRQIREDSCSKDKYRYDTDNGEVDLMASGCWTGGKPTAKEADIRRMNYVFDHYGSGGSMGIISYVEMRGSKMKHLMSRVLPNHPDLGMWVSDFAGLTQSAAGKEIDKFSFSDPRVSLVGKGTGPVQGVFEPDTLFPVIVPMHENVRWLHIFNGSSDEEMIVIDLGPAIWNYCNETNWEDDYCKIVDLNTNGIPDYKENWSLEEAIEVMKEKAPEAEAPDIEGEPQVSYNPQEEPVGPAGPTEPAPEKPKGMDWTLLIVVIVVIAAVLFAAILKKVKKPKT